jgi:4-amino-4-deoxy-L-arabinose transferase-like glycosyltransferase
MKKNIILCSFILLKFLIQYFLISPEYELHRDEYLHLDQAHHLAWGFLSVPPVTSWISYIIYLLGNSVFWIKFFPALFGALTMVVVWKSIEALKGDLSALILGTTCVLFSALLRLNTLYQPNSLDVLMWTSFYYIIIQYFKTEKTKWLFMGAIVFAIGFLNKYNIAFLLIGLLPALLMTPQRKVLIKKEFYLSLLLGFLLITPNILWQYNNHFPVIHHLNELSERQLVNVDRWGFIKSQLLFFIGSILVIFSSFYALIFYKPYKKYQSFFWIIAFTLTVFIYFKAKDYYAIGLYPIYIAFGSVYFSDVLKHGWKRYLQPVFIAVPLLFFIPISKVAFPNKSPKYVIEHSEQYQKLGLLRWEDGKDHVLPQDFADMLGWKELAQKVDKAYSNLPNTSKTLVLCDNYGQAGAINYFTNQKIKAVSFNADYINWFDLSQKYDNLIRVKEKEDTYLELAETAPFFQKAIVSDSVTNPYAREYRTTIFSFVKANIDINERIKSEIESEKY